MLGFNLLVVLWGAVVRATGSGDGCGASWPRCGDRLVPIDAGTETTIEFLHRVTSGLAVVGVVILVVLAFLWYPRGHPARRAAVAAAFLLAVESLLGAGLVVFGWVDQDVSVGRMLAVPTHLTNTLLLLGALAVGAWSATRPVARRFSEPGAAGMLLAGLVVLVVVAASGALNAVADTVFPAESLIGGVAAELGSTAPFLLRVRLAHPFVAVLGGLLVIWIAVRVADGGDRTTRRLAMAVGGLVAVQLFIGVANVFLLAPLEIQVLHLAVGDLLWVVFVLLAAARTAPLPATRYPVEVP